MRIQAVTEREFCLRGRPMGGQAGNPVQHPSRRHQANQDNEQPSQITMPFQRISNGAAKDHSLDHIHQHDDPTKHHSGGDPAACAACQFN